MSIISLYGLCISTDELVARGSSGAWVVQGSYLVGMIIAVYDDEPYAHMLEVASVFSDIRALLSDGEHVPSVRVAGGICLADPPKKDCSVDELLLATQISMASTLASAPKFHKAAFAFRKNRLLARLPAKPGLAAGSDPEKQELQCTDIPEPISLRHKTILGAAALACFCVHLVCIGTALL